MLHAAWQGFLKTRLAAWLAGRLFEHYSFLIPYKRKAETGSLLAFRHPRPDYPYHVVIVPKRRCLRFEDLPPEDTAFLSDLVRTVQTLIKEDHLDQSEYRLLVNGGSNQSFPQLHFHLISSTSPLQPPGDTHDRSITSAD